MIVGKSNSRIRLSFGKFSLIRCAMNVVNPITMAGKIELKINTHVFSSGYSFPTRAAASDITPIPKGNIV